jgi:transcriptional regulator with XRE-family HTH domain
MARAIRIAAGVTQQQLADEIPAHVTTIARWENATRRPRGAMRARYAELLEQLRAEVE